VAKTPGQGLRHLSLLNNFLDVSEKFGNGNLRSHSALTKGEQQFLKISVEMGFPNSEMAPKFEMGIQSNKTVLSLKIELAKKLHCNWDQIKLVRGYGNNYNNG